MRMPGGSKTGDLASGIYGTILVTAEVAVASSHEGATALAGIALVLVTTLVFWLAHVYSDLLALRHRQESRPTWSQVRGEMLSEWPIVEAAALPVIILLMGATGLLATSAAFTVAMWSGVATLFVWGIVMARREQQGVLATLASAVVTASFGLAIVLLKILIA